MNTYETDRDLTASVTALVTYTLETGTLTATLEDGTVLPQAAVLALMGADAFATLLASVAEDAADAAADADRERAAGASDYL